MKKQEKQPEAKKPYQPPRVTSSTLHERAALTCSKNMIGIPSCDFYVTSS